MSIVYIFQSFEHVSFSGRI